MIGDDSSVPGSRHHPEGAGPSRGRRLRSRQGNDKRACLKIGLDSVCPQTLQWDRWRSCWWTETQKSAPGVRQPSSSSGCSEVWPRFTRRRLTRRSRSSASHLPTRPTAWPTRSKRWALRISGPGGRSTGRRFEFAPQRMGVNLLRAELSALRPPAKTSQPAPAHKYPGTSRVANSRVLFYQSNLELKRERPLAGLWAAVLCQHKFDRASNCSINIAPTLPKEAGHAEVNRFVGAPPWSSERAAQSRPDTGKRRSFRAAQSKVRRNSSRPLNACGIVRISCS